MSILQEHQSFDSANKDISALLYLIIKSWHVPKHPWNFYYSPSIWGASCCSDFDFDSVSDPAYLYCVVSFPAKVTDKRREQHYDIMQYFFFKFFFICALIFCVSEGSACLTLKSKNKRLVSLRFYVQVTNTHVVCMIFLILFRKVDLGAEIS